jgi:hypothetical protein
VTAVDSHRQALRAGSSWLVLALGPLIAAHALPALLGAVLQEPPAWLLRTAALLGLVGSVAMLLALAQLALARVGGRRHPALLLAAAAWATELGARVAPLNDAAAQVEVWSGVQLVASSCALWFAANGVLWILRAQQAADALAAWKRVRSGFTVLTLSAASVLISARMQGPERTVADGLAAVPYGGALAWIVFALPWALLVLAARANVRWLGRVRSTAEILAR